MSQILKEENTEKSAILVSIIVAIYKVEDFLEQCIQTILDQIYRNIEVILVDDCSPDRSVMGIVVPAQSTCIVSSGLCLISIVAFLI